MLPQRARNRAITRIACGSLAAFALAGQAAEGAARPRASILEASGLLLEDRATGPPAAVGVGQRLQVGAGGEATVVAGDVAFKVLGPAAIRVVGLTPQIKLQVDSGVLIVVAARGTEVRAMTSRARATARNGAFFLRQAVGEPTYICACGGRVQVGERSGPLTEIPRPHHVALDVGSFEFKPASVDHHGGQDLWALVLALGPGRGDEMRELLWDAIARPPAHLAYLGSRLPAPPGEPAPKADAAAHAPDPGPPTVLTPKPTLTPMPTLTPTPTLTPMPTLTPGPASTRMPAVVLSPAPTATPRLPASTSLTVAFPPPRRMPAPTPTPKRGETPPPALETLFPDADFGGPEGR